MEPFVQELRRMILEGMFFTVCVITELARGPRWFHRQLDYEPIDQVSNRECHQRHRDRHVASLS
jgi:hypothetical protein